jgi:hypothetical protein
MRLRRRAEQQHAEPFDGHPEGDYQQAGDDADEDGEQKKDSFFASRRDASNDVFGCSSRC